MIKKDHLNRWLFFAVFISACASPQTKALRIAEGIMKSNDPDPREVYSFASSFREGDFSTARLNKYPDAAVNRLYDALYRAAYYFPENSRYITMQENVFKEISARNIYTKSDIPNMYKIYLGARMFAKAADLRKRFPEIKLNPMPEKIISDIPPGSYAWRVYNVEDEGNTIELKALQFDKGPRVALLMLPGCEIAETAMGEILADPVLAPIFRERGTVITNRVNAGTIALWKKYFNFPEVYLAYKASDFPGFDFGSSPNFYFLWDGKIKYSFSGWSNPNIPGLGKNEMLKGLAAISISTSSVGAQVH